MRVAQIIGIISKMRLNMLLRYYQFPTVAGKKPVFCSRYEAFYFEWDGLEIYLISVIASNSLE